MWILRKKIRYDQSQEIVLPAQSIAQVMTDLTQELLEASTAFKNFGVGYFGPFTVKLGRRIEKRWCSLFT